MPRRVVDGDCLWVSEKLADVQEEFRVEYAWIIPLSQVNGCFECSPMLVWRSCYAALRPSWSVDKVKAMLEDFERVKMLFRFKRGTKTYGFFPGIQKEGRLPKPSDRLKSAKEWQHGMVPKKEFAEFLGNPPDLVEEEYGGSRDILAKYSRVSRPHDDAIVDDAVLVDADDADKADEDEYENVNVTDNVGSAATSGSTRKIPLSSSSSPSEKDGKSISIRPAPPNSISPLKASPANSISRRDSGTARQCQTPHVLWARYRKLGSNAAKERALSRRTIARPAPRRIQRLQSCTVLRSRLCQWTDRRF